MNNLEALNKGFKHLVSKNKDPVVIQNINGYEEEVILHLNAPARDEDLSILLEKISYKLPKDYEDFLRITNGCMLFGEENELYNVDTVIEQKDIIDLTYEKSELLNVAYILQDYIIINLEEAAQGKSEYVYVIDSYSPIEYLRSLKCDFQTWLDRFIVSQGNKYWDWI
ncbi:SMI1/KNR4 family protein [Paenibacillus faecalis]|uniref:SMI1/KNR4 family protein n=1 Tax=Paenibacillus faecalis TaxID=2079532 RepID=UPI00131A5DBE|nr:SMI1/KNR4 family protein [Paenibacillus faecalis]